MNDEISVADLIGVIADIMQVDVDILSDEERVRPDKSEVERLFCDNAKILSKTDWKPEYKLRDGLRETIEWFKHNLQYYKAEIYNV
jgi:nucleoside-diphosphate-sugar epimerase